MNIKTLLLTVLVMALFIGLLTLVHYYPTVGLTILVGTAGVLFAILVYTTIDVVLSKNDKK